MWSARVTVSLSVAASQSLMVLSWEPVAKVLWLGWTASDSMELPCARFRKAVGGIWFFMRSCSREILEPADCIII